MVILQSIMFCVFLQADSGSEFTFQGMCVYQSHGPDSMYTDVITQDRQAKCFPPKTSTVSLGSLKRDRLNQVKPKVGYIPLQQMCC